MSFLITVLWINKYKSCKLNNTFKAAPDVMFIASVLRHPVLSCLQYLRIYCLSIKSTPRGVFYTLFPDLDQKLAQPRHPHKLEHILANFEVLGFRLCTIDCSPATVTLNSNWRWSERGTSSPVFKQLWQLCSEDFSWITSLLLGFINAEATSPRSTVSELYGSVSK